MEEAEESIVSGAGCLPPVGDARPKVELQDLAGMVHVDFGQRVKVKMQDRWPPLTVKNLGKI